MWPTRELWKIAPIRGEAASARAVKSRPMLTSSEPAA
jgi:hypothetical protein